MRLANIVLTGAFMLPASGAGAAAEAKPFHLEEASIAMCRPPIGPGIRRSSTATASIGVPVGIEFLGRPWTLVRECTDRDRLRL
jgi:hypothetical protein